MEELCPSLPRTRAPRGCPRRRPGHARRHADGDGGVRLAGDHAVPRVPGFGIIGAVGMSAVLDFGVHRAPRGGHLVGARVKGNDPASSARSSRALSQSVPASSRRSAVVLLAVTSVATVRYLSHDPLEDDCENLRSENPDLDAEGAWMGKFDKAFGNGIEGGFVIGVERAARGEHRRRQAAERGQREARTSAPLQPHQHAGRRAAEGSAEEARRCSREIRELLDTGFVRHMSEEDQAKLKKLRPPDDLHPLTYDGHPGPAGVAVHRA